MATKSIQSHAGTVRTVIGQYVLLVFSPKFIMLWEKVKMQ